MQEDIVVFEALFAHDGGTNLAKTYTVSPTATIENEARWNGGAVGIWNLIAISIKAHKGKRRTIKM